MASLMINGARHAIATAMSVAAAFTGASNATPPVLLSGAPPAADSIVLVNSGWSLLNEVVGKVGTVVPATSFQLLGYDATSTALFPPGEGAGVIRVASSFVNLPKIHDIQSSGGDAEFFQRQYVADPSGKKIQVPTSKSPQSRTFMLDYDPSLPHFAALVTLDTKRELCVLRETLPNGDTIYYAGYISFNKEPTRTINEFMSNQLVFSLSSDSIRYAA